MHLPKEKEDRERLKEEVFDRHLTKERKWSLGCECVNIRGTGERHVQEEEKCLRRNGCERVGGDQTSNIEV